MDLRPVLHGVPAQGGQLVQNLPHGSILRQQAALGLFVVVHFYFSKYTW